MVKRVRGRKPRRPLRGWIRWIPFLALPFSVLFAETYLHTQRLRNDYEINELTSEIDVLKRRIRDREAERAALENKRLIDARAVALNFVEPAPGQIEVVQVSGGPVPEEEDPEWADLAATLGELELPEP